MPDPTKRVGHYRVRNFADLLEDFRALWANLGTALRRQIPIFFDLLGQEGPPSFKANNFCLGRQGLAVDRGADHSFTRLVRPRGSPDDGENDCGC